MAKLTGFENYYDVTGQEPLASLTEPVKQEQSAVSLPKARLFPEDAGPQFPKADLFSQTLNYAAPKQADIEPTLTRTADKVTGTTVTKPTEIAAPAMGAGGDEGMDRVGLAEALSRGLGAVYQGATGQKLETGIPEMLATLKQRREAQKQREAELAGEYAREDLKFKREEERDIAKEERRLAQERDVNRAQVAMLKKAYPEQAAAGFFDDLEAAAGKPPFAAAARVLENALMGPGKRELTGAQTANVTAKTAGIAPTTAANIRLKDAQTKKALADAARSWKQATDVVKEENAQLKLSPEDARRRLTQKDRLISDTKPFTDIASTIKEAESALTDLKGSKLSLGTRLFSDIPGLRDLLPEEQKRAKAAIQRLQAAQMKLETGLGSVGAERESIQKAFGTDFLGDPTRAPAALEMVKRLAKDRLRAVQAPYGVSGDPGLDRFAVLDAYKKVPDALTAESPVFQTQAPSGQVSIRNKKTDDVVKLDAATAEKVLSKPELYERVY